MSLWQEYLTRKLVFESHPSLNEKHCLNHLQTRHPCTVCIDICPENVFSMPHPGSMETDWDLCTDCGLCVSICPARAVSPARLQAEKLYACASHCTGDIIISCKSGSVSDFTLENPGAIPWELLCFLALQGTVTIVTGSCPDCEKKTCRSSLDQTLAQTRAFLGDEMYRSRIHCTQDPASLPSRLYTRREAMSLALRRTGRTASALLPVPPDSVPDGTLWRQLLLYRVKQFYTDSGDPEALEERKDPSAGPSGNPAVKSKSGAPVPALRWTVPQFSASCTACGICMRMCPSGALLRAPGPEGSARFYMALLPHKCTGCGLCSRVCPVQGMLAPSPVHLNPVDRPILHAVAAKSCSRCREPVPADSGSDLCDRCRAELEPG